MDQDPTETSPTENGGDVLPTPMGTLRFAKGLVVAALFLLISLAVGLKGFLEVEKCILDQSMRLFNDLPPELEQVVIVDINPHDYTKLFHAQSPLDPDLLRNLIERVAQSKPRIIGVDIDTSAPAFAPLQTVAWPIPVVWARDARITDEGKLVPLRVLGGDPAQEIVSSGLAILYDDRQDCVTRRYSRVIATGQGPEPSFPWKIFKTCCIEKLREPAKESAEQLTIQYRPDGKRRKIPASLIIADPLAWKDRIQNKIVLIGGSYERDQHTTPLGPGTSGVTVIANVIETELRGGGLAGLSFSQLLLVAGIEGVVLFFVFKKLPTKKAVGLSLLIIPLAALLLVPFESGANWLHSLLRQVSILCGLLLVKIIERFIDFQRDHTFNEVFNVIRERWRNFVRPAHRRGGP